MEPGVDANVGVECTSFGNGEYAKEENGESGCKKYLIGASRMTRRVGSVLSPTNMATKMIGSLVGGKKTT